MKAWNARIRGGASAADIVEGVKRYAAYCQAKGIVGTSYVKQAATFFGPDEHWSLPWVVLSQATGAPVQSIPGKVFVGGRWVEW